MMALATWIQAEGGVGENTTAVAESYGDDDDDDDVFGVLPLQRHPRFG